MVKDVMDECTIVEKQTPIDFISQAEETGVINNIGDWLLREVCRNYRQWLDEDLPEIKISVNYSSIQFFENNFVEKLWLL
jgi:EAL domain-containing protein (putative c-di-GMP-specific phosphodiesterase class I)